MTGKISFSLFCNQLGTQPDLLFAWNDTCPPCSLLRRCTLMNQDWAYLSPLKWCCLQDISTNLAFIWQKEQKTKLKDRLPARKKFLQRMGQSDSNFNKSPQ